MTHWSLACSLHGRCGSFQPCKRGTLSDGLVLFGHLSDKTCTCHESSCSASWGGIPNARDAGRRTFDVTVWTERQRLLCWKLTFYINVVKCGYNYYIRNVGAQYFLLLYMTRKARC